jgi:hypothetical protein
MPPDVQSLRTEAERCVKRGELKEALALYGQILAADPTDAAATARIKALNDMEGETLGMAVARPLQPVRPSKQQLYQVLLERIAQRRRPATSGN